MNTAIATASSTVPPQADSLQQALSTLEHRFPQRTAHTAAGAVSYREFTGGHAEDGPVFVLLHGIGSGAASWLHCAVALAEQAPGARIIAWNAPGYGASATLAQARPGAASYAARLRELLLALGIFRCTLVGHSLGAMMAAAYAQAYAGTLDRLVLVSPARGYGCAARLAQGAQVAHERLSTLGELGIPGMATQRSGRLLSHHASAAQRDWVRWNMAQLHAAGYTQAVHLLCGDAIENYAPASLAGVVWCGADDAITTPEDSRTVATQFGLPFRLVANAGHACYVEQPEAVAHAILNRTTKENHEQQA
ncbi:alpha/beta fold hydrolase [Duganella sp. FT92W]|uniref:Alpha/beta fold hydrolase n=1 Tax=Pseudoduganella rivuli TaxID=2666085 RepID=A0A7X2ISX1_9BURK|nr:alpha/beta hydrolase [Pseudoduganella rivuli]MRV75380.1 alpha/beta fold hydrolase [Pseudoduganella rivuli]